MSVEQLSQRLQDLRFSFEEQIKASQAENDKYDDAYSAWEDDESEDKGDEPEHVDNNSVINALEKAKDLIDEAIDALDSVDD